MTKICPNKMRFEKANETLKRRKADYLLITQSASVRYFCGFVSSNAALLYSPNERFLFTDSRYKTSAQNFCEAQGWKFIEAKQSEFAKKISKILKKGSKLLFQDNYLSVAEFERYQKDFKALRIKFISGGGEIDGLFCVKTDEELNFMEQAAQIADKSSEKWLKKLRAGISEFEAARLLDVITLQNGSEKTAFDTIVLFGENCALPHGVPSKKRLLRNGDFILYDFGCVVEGFCSDMTRTVCFGEAKSEDRNIYEAVLDAQKKGLAAVKAGVKAKDIDKVVRDSVKEAGFGEYFKHATGHSIGLCVHENPSVNGKNESVLQSGTVITVEPGIYIPDRVGVRIEDTVVVQDKDCKIITNTAKDFICIKT